MFLTLLQLIPEGYDKKYRGRTQGARCFDGGRSLLSLLINANTITTA
jgi:hypothetical protein